MLQSCKDAVSSAEDNSTETTRHRNHFFLKSHSRLLFTSRTVRSSPWYLLLLLHISFFFITLSTSHIFLLHISFYFTSFSTSHLFLLHISFFITSPSLSHFLLFNISFLFTSPYPACSSLLNISSVLSSSILFIIVAKEIYMAGDRTTLYLMGREL